LPKFVVLLSAGLILLSNTFAFAEDFYLESPFNTRMLRLQIDNDVVWNEDSHFSSGLSLQYHTLRFADWEETPAPGLVKWVGNHLLALNDDASMVRYGHALGQSIYTPAQLKMDTPQAGDLPYAGTLTYSFSWQRFNRRMARNLMVTIGVLGREALAENSQKIAHHQLGFGDNPEGWDTQRDSEPVFNVGYPYTRRLFSVGETTNGWAGQLALQPSIALGNINTAVKAGLGLRWGWNMMEGFIGFPERPGWEFIQQAYVPKPPSASLHSVEMVLGVSGTALAYSALYDGSVLRGDDRSVERETFFASGVLGFIYRYHPFFSIGAYLRSSTDLLKKDSLPDPLPGGEKTNADISYGILMIDFYF
jgi:hypothetical protein